MLTIFYPPKQLGTRALFRLAQTNRVLFELVIPHLYKDFRCTVRRRKDDLDERLTSALDTLTSHTNNYASHVRDFAIAGEWFRSYATADAEYAKKGKLSPGVLMLNSLVKLAMLKMPNLDSFAYVYTFLDLILFEENKISNIND